MFYVIKLGSITNAQRGAKLLRANGYKPNLSRLENPQPSDGCGYAVTVNTNDIDDAVKLLKKSGVTVLGVGAK